MKLLLTAFEPFNQLTENASLDVLNAIHLELKGLILIKEVLPVVYAHSIYKELLLKHHPDFVILMGEAGNRSLVNLEYRGVNKMSASVPDNCGVLKSDELILTNGPTELIETLGSKGIVDHLATQGYPLALSHTAGTFICNLALYSSLLAVSDLHMKTKVGFIHLPRLSHQSNPVGMPTLTLKAAVDTVIAIINEIR
jgi:pyroglutamyl-peptidase